MEEKFKTYEKPVLEIERAEGEKTVQERVEDLISNRLPSDNMDSAIMRQQMTQFLDNFMQTRQMTGEVLQAQQNAISEKDEEARSNCKAIRVLSKLAYKQEKKRLQQPDFQQGGNTYIFNGGDNVVGKVETGHVNQVNIASTDIKH